MKHIPEHMEPVAAIEYMAANHYENRHPECGEHLGQLFTYYEICVEQHIREKNHEEKTNHAISKSRGGSGSKEKVEVADRRDGDDVESSGERDSMAIRKHADREDSDGKDSGADGESGSGQSVESGAESGQRGERPPAPDASLTEKLAYWKSRV